MACDLTKGRALNCKDVVGGVVRAWLIDFGDLGTVTQTDDQITDVSGTFNAYQYDLKGTNSLEQAITSSRENGTTFFEQTITLTLPKLTKEDNKEFKLLAHSRPHLALEDRNGNFMLCGLEHGCEVTGGSISTGTNFGDLSGYTLTLAATEAKPANFIKDGSSTNPFAGMTSVIGGSAVATVVVGTNS